jgi:predicted RNA-binding Zn-ribbon protein involved in translation (DUF1610 family)
MKALTSLQKVQRQIDRANKALALAVSMRDDILRDTLVTCEPSNSQPYNSQGGPCFKQTKIKDLVYHRKNWYTSPHGCSGGDYWSVDKDDALFKCPHCGHVNRLYKHPEIMALYRLFKSIEDVYEH